LLGFGASSISSVGSAYSQDEKDLQAYQQAVGEGRLPVVRGYLLDDDDVIRRELLLDLFCNFRLDLKALGERFGIDARSYLADDFQRLEPMQADGLLTFDDERIEVTTIGRFFIRNICMTFDRHLESDSSKRVYSRTV
jgi:oxygen-independent coproporphyrinogen-3 oxidase